MADEANYYERETIKVLCEVEIKYKRGSEAARQDALDCATRIGGGDINAGGVGPNGSYGACVTTATVVD